MLCPQRPGCISLFSPLRGDLLAHLHIPIRIRPSTSTPKDDPSPTAIAPCPDPSVHPHVISLPSQQNIRVRTHQRKHHGANPRRALPPEAVDAPSRRETRREPSDGVRARDRSVRRIAHVEAGREGEEAVWGSRGGAGAEERRGERVERGDVVAVLAADGVRIRINSLLLRGSFLKYSQLSRDERIGRNRISWGLCSARGTRAQTHRREQDPHHDRRETEYARRRHPD